MHAKSRRIGIFGGTFDPVHNGHVSIARSFLKSDFIHSLWIFLNPSPPHKPNAKITSYASRLKMLNAAFNSVEQTVVSNLEARLPAPTYTVQTVKHLASVYPLYTFYLCMGKDSFASFTDWHKWNQILNYCNLLVANRPAEGGEEIDPKLLSHAAFVEHSPLDISSTEIRDKIAKGKPIDRLVPSSVLKIIREENLYR